MVSLHVALVALAVSGAPETALLDFYTDWCGPCRQMEGTVRQLAQRGYPVRKVNAERERQLAAQFRVEQVPCFVLVVNGREVGRIEGTASLDELERMLVAAGVTATATGGAKTRAQSPDEAPQPQTVPFPAVRSGPPLESARAPDVHLADRAGSSTGMPQPAAAQLPSDEVAARIAAASVRIKIDDGGSRSVGSGTIIDARSGEALVLTCGHIFRDSGGKGPISVDLFGQGLPQALPGRLISYDLASDVGLVSFRPGVAVTVARIAPAGYQVRQDDPVISVGCNHGDAPTARTSRVTAIDKFLGPPNLVVAGQPVQGRSGGGLFTTDGQVIGVCNAADPADDEGLFAALASVQAELERIGLAEFCLETQPGDGATVASPPPPMPDRMPLSADHPSAARLVPTATAETDRRSELASRALTTHESAALAEIGRRSADAEVICIIRPLSDPNAKSEILLLDQASPEFLEELAAQRRAQQRRGQAPRTSDRIPGLGGPVRR